MVAAISWTDFNGKFTCLINLDADFSYASLFPILILNAICFVTFESVSMGWEIVGFDLNFFTQELQNSAL